MKNFFMLITVVFILLLSFSGCKKSSNTETLPAPDARAKFMGTWQGVVSENKKSTSDTLTLALALQSDNNLAEGYVTLKKVVYKIIQSSFNNGVFTFTVINYDPACQSYSLTFTITMDTSGNLVISLTGNYCDTSTINVTGTLGKASSIADLSNIVTFARVGHSWTWRVTNFDNSTCSFTYTMGKDYQNGVYKFNMSTTCNWQTFGSIGWWYVSPQEWADMTDSIPFHKFTNFRTDATVGTVYRTISDQDTVVNTVESLDDPVTINNQTYHCVRIHTHQFHYPSYVAEGKAWCNYQYGFVKFENLLTGQPASAVHLEELISKNF